MKLLVLTLSFFSISAFASFNEVECTGKLKKQKIRFEIEQPFPRDSFFLRSELTVNTGDEEEVENYTVTRRSVRNFSKVQYHGAGVRLEVDHWPDPTPRWGRNYKGSLYSSLLRTEISNIKCKFPNAF